VIRHSMVLMGLAFWFVPPALVGQEIGVVSLDEAVRLFAVNNQELRGARARVAEAVGMARQAGAFPNPLLTASHEPLSGGGTSYSESYLTLSQRFELPGERGARADAGDWTARAAQSRLIADSARLAFEVKETFVETANAQERLEVIGRVAQAFRDAARIASERFDAGDISLYELLRIRVERARYETLAAQADVSVGVAQRSLALLVSPSERAHRIAAAALPGDSPPPVSAAILAAPTAERRLELAGARAEVEAFEARARLARAERVPDLTATGGVKRQSDGLRGGFLGLSLPLPLFDRGGGALDAASAGVVGSGERLERTRSELENDALGAAEAYRAHLQRAELVTEEEDQGASAAGDLLDIARVAYDEGEMELIELLDAAEAMYQARTAEARLRADLWVSYFNLERALGGFETAGGSATEDLP